MHHDQLTDEALLAELAAAMKDEGERLASVIAMLVEVEGRRLDRQLAFPSLFEFCTQRLGMSGGQAFRRCATARLVKRFPRLLGFIRSREIHISNLVLVRHLLTEKNFDEVVKAISGRSRREVEALVATLAPKPDVPSCIRKTPTRLATPTPTSTPTPTPASKPTPLPPPTLVFAPPPTLLFERHSTEPVLALSFATPGSAPAVPPAAPALPQPPRPIPPRAQLSALSETRHKVQFTVTTEQREKIERALQLRKHRDITGDIASMMEAAVDLLIAKLEKEKLAATTRPRSPANPTASAPAATTRPRSPADPTAGAPVTTTRPRSPANPTAGAPATSSDMSSVTRSSDSRPAIPAAVRREVLARDGEQCAYVSPAGERCGARELLELDHVNPRAMGGGNEPSNLRVFCRSHNRFAAEQAFGREHIERAIASRRRKRETPPAPSPNESARQTPLPLG